MMKLKVNRLTKNLCFQPKMSFLDYLPSPLPPKDPFGSITPSCFPKEPFLSLLPSLPPSLRLVLFLLYLFVCLLGKETACPLKTEFIVLGQISGPNTVNFSIPRQ